MSINGRTITGEINSYVENGSSAYASFMAYTAYDGDGIEALSDAVDLVMNPQPAGPNPSDLGGGSNAS